VIYALEPPGTRGKIAGKFKEQEIKRREKTKSSYPKKNHCL
jgi:hypothetical protein